MTIARVNGLSERLCQERVVQLPLTDHSWIELGSNETGLKTLAIRPVHVRTRQVALLIIGSQSALLDDRTLARLDDLGTALTKTLEAQLI